MAQGFVEGSEVLHHLASVGMSQAEWWSVENGVRFPDQTQSDLLVEGLFEDLGGPEGFSSASGITFHGLFSLVDPWAFACLAQSQVSVPGSGLRAIGSSFGSGLLKCWLVSYGRLLSERQALMLLRLIDWQLECR